MPFDFGRAGVAMAILSAHKFGGPKGSGALILQPGTEIAAHLCGGGQEAGRRSGTENLTGIAGLGAAIEAAARDVAEGLWQGVAEMRDMLEQEIASIAPEAIIPGQGAARLPNTSCIVVPGWRGETQVMQMDMAGFAISAGSACSSGKVRASKVLQAMGFDGLTASSAIRVSLGPQTTSDQVMAFAGAWEKQYRRFRQQRAA
jgi:cysteine desulfurase